MLERFLSRQIALYDFISSWRKVYIYNMRPHREILLNKYLMSLSNYSAYFIVVSEIFPLKNGCRRKYNLKESNEVSPIKKHGNRRVFEYTCVNKHVSISILKNCSLISVHLFRMCISLFSLHIWHWINNQEIQLDVTVSAKVKEKNI